MPKRPHRGTLRRATRGMLKKVTCGTSDSQGSTQVDDARKYDEYTTPFPEKIGKYLHVGYYKLWIFVGLALLVARVGTMLLSGEELGLYMANIIFALLPSTLAILIIFYSKEIEKLTKTLCNIIDKDKNEAEEWCKVAIQNMFDNWSMVVSGLVFVIIMVLFVPYTQLYPTPEHNQEYRTKVSERKKMNFARLRGSWKNQDFNATVGWADLSLGKARKLAKGKIEEDFFKELEPINDSPQDRVEAQPSSLQPLWDAIVNLKGDIINKQEWRLSAIVYYVIMVFTLFMSGAMFWCLYWIVKFAWRLGREHTVNVDVYPHPFESIKAVGRLLGLIAFINGIIYALVMMGVIISRPDKLMLIISCFFSLTVVATFVIPQFHLHRLMIEIKYEKISKLTKAFQKAFDQLGENSKKDDIERAQAILQLQQSLTVASEWPFDIKALIAVISSVVIPLFMVLLAIFEQFK